jgi:epoxyqueuosine reductase
MSLKNDIKEFALSKGVQLIAMTGVEAYGDYLAEVRSRLKETGAGFEDFMNAQAANMSGSQDMAFFTQISDARKNLPTAKSIIVLGVYGYDENAIYKNTRRELLGKTARIYSYYPVIRQIAESTVSFIKDHGHRAIQGQHIPLKFAADRIGLEVYGKNGILQTAQYGSYVALRNVLTEAELAPDKFEINSTPCDECEKCIKACPTGALYAPYKVNPRLCINPFTRRDTYIEPRIRSKMQNWIIGCDICQEVCPANRNLNPRQMDSRSGFDPKHHASHKYLDGIEKTPDLISLLDTGRSEIIRRNAAIALANTGKGRIEAVIALNEQLCNVSPGLKEYFVWAIEKIGKNEVV